MVITLTTDFGTADHYVAAMKGVILGIAPKTTIVDISHQIPPQDIIAGALCLKSVCEVFPKSAIHVAVVDPGVGSNRFPIAVSTEHGTYVGPDNGLLSLAVDQNAPFQAVRLNNHQYHRHLISDTFHGRDIFAPVAAHLATGVPLGELGDPHWQLVPADIPMPTTDGSTITAHVIHIDHFGNLVTNLTREYLIHQLQMTNYVGIIIDLPGGVQIQRIVNSYSQVARNHMLAYFGSMGVLEIAARDTSASQLLNMKNGDMILVKVARP